MPYKGSSDKNLPSYVKKMPAVIRAKWVSIFNSVYDKGGESVAFRTANSWLKKHIDATSGELAGKAGVETTRIYSLKFSLPDERLVVKAIGDEEYIEAVLTDVDSDEDGDSYDESFLYELAEQINKNGIVGDFDHSELERLRKIGFDSNTIASLLKDKKGVAKAVKAIVKSGRLWIRAMIDKRYKKRILDSNGLSLEGLFRKKEGTNVYEAGTIVGFTFAEKQTARNPRARVVA